ncbi:hypothetical protein AgCh_003119 [Apium graveolens]
MGIRSSLWLQFKPHQIAVGGAYLAAKSMNMDLTSSQHVWQEFQTPSSVLKVPVATFLMAVVCGTDKLRWDIFLNMLLVSVGVVASPYGEIHFNVIGTT